MFVLFLIIVFLIDFSVNYENVPTSEAEELYKILLENLRVDPFLLESGFTDEAKRFIDNKIDSFVNLFEHSESSIRTKRSSVQSDGNVVELKLYRKNARMYPKDLRLFKQDTEWFAAYLEGTNENEREERIVIKHYQNDSSIPEAQHKVRDGVNIAVLPMEFTTFIAVSENVTHGMNIYEFHRNNGLKVIQTINSSHAIDVALWKDKQQNAFMSVVQSVQQSENETSKVQIAFYKWNGECFVMFQADKTYGTKKITPFFIGDDSYVAVANSEDENGNWKTYSEILKFNLHKEKYEIVQRILTYGCSDIEYFRTNFNNELEHFVITSSYYFDKESEVKHRNRKIAHSIIYKFVDDFFMPFQSTRIDGVRKWLPIQMETGGNVILLAFTPEGLHCLQNDGWGYENCETHLKNVSSDTMRDVSVLHYGELQDRKLLVILTKNSDEVLVEINFSHENKVRKLHDELLSWCMDSVKLVDSLSDNILGDARRGDNMEQPDSASQQIITEEDKLAHELSQYEQQVVEFNDTIHKNLESDNLFDGDSKLVANSIILNGPGIMKSVDVQLIQSTSVQEILNNVLDLNEGFEISDEITFETMYAPEGIEITEKINNVDKNTILHTDDSIEFNDLSVQGDVRCEEQLKVSETINNIRFDYSEILLRTGDQNVSEFSVDRLFVQNLVSNIFENTVANKSQSSITSVEKLIVKDLKVGGYLNGVKISTLNKYALRNSGDQDLTTPCYFNHLEVNHLESKKISGKNILQEVVKISEGDFHLSKDVRFTQDLSANNIMATKLFNSIAVTRNGGLDVLLTDSPEQQFIEGIKAFEDLELFDSIDLHGKIHGKALDKLKNFVTIESNLELEGDKRITGDVIAEEIIRADNIVSSERLNSLRRVRSEALRLTDVEIPNRMSFFQHLNVDDVFARRINNIDARLLVVNGAKQTQVLEGWKKFKGDLEITGNTEVLKINSFDMKEMERNVMKRSGDQFVSGKHYVKFVAADGGIKSNITKFGNLPWKDVIRTNEDQSINGTITFSKNLTAKSISAQIVDLEGLINGENFTEILNDAVTHDSTRRINGTKTFKNITIHFLELTKKLEESEMDLTTVRLSDIDVMDTVSVRNIVCNEKLNDIAKEDFRDFWDEEFELVLDGDETLGNVTVYGNVYIDSNRIGDISLEDLENNTVKTDESFEFDTVEFYNIVVNNGIDLKGHVENLDLDNVPQNNQTNEATNISHEKTFHLNVSIDGRILINDTLNNFSVSELCGFVSSSSDEKHLILKGNATFAKGPKVKRVNNFELQELLNRSWFRDRPVNISSSVRIENLNLLDDLFVGEYVNGQNVTKLADKYFSKSREQHINGFHIFAGSVLFREDVASPELIIDGDINGINMEKFMKSVLLHRPQLFEDAVYFENIIVESVDGSYNINGLDLENDVMRYDKPNKVVGMKVFTDLNANILRLDKNVEVQEVDLLALTTGAILKNGRFRIVGKPLIASATFQEGFSLKGNLNSVSFDEETLLLKRSPQNITGRVSFGAQAETKFKALKVRGLVNNADIGELLHNQVSRNGDTTIKSAMHFHKNIKAKNVNFEGLCQGINVTELLMNITKLSSLNNQKENYQNLLKYSRNIENSFKGQAFYLSDFKLTFAEKGATVLKLQGKDEKMGLLSCRDNSMFIELFNWNEEYYRFEKGYSKMLGAFPGFSTKVTIRGIDYIYYETEKEHHITVQEEYSPPSSTGVIEEPYMNIENNPGRDAQSLETLDNTHTGFLLSTDNDTTYSRMPFLTKGTIFMTSFEIPVPRIDCLLFIDYQYETNINCMGEDEEFYFLQNIREEKAYTASFINVGDNPYLITLANGMDNGDTRMIIWKFNRATEHFEIHQNIYMEDPRFLSTISSPHGYFISVTYDYKMTTLDFGNIVLWRFDTKYGKFLKWQNIKVDAPIRAEFALLPSEELSLYVLTQNPVSPLIVYIYEGIAGFKEKMISSLIPNVQYMNQFSIRNDHFLVLQNSDGINILRGIFKGHKCS